eukprot:Gb_16854 [translate_table: standard]
MAADAASNDTRVLIAHLPSQTSPKSATVGAVEGQLLHLRHPKSGNPTCYILMDGCLQELHWFKQRYGSWFLGEYVCEDGSLYVATPIDPIFVVLPLLDQARMKKGDEPGKFRALDEIMFVEGYPGYNLLLPLMHDLLVIVCEVKEIGSLKFYRLDDCKLLAWLCCKAKCTAKILPTINKLYASRSEDETVLDAIGLLGEYLQEDPWMYRLCSCLCVDLEATKKSRVKDAECIDLTSEKNVVQDFQGGNNADRGRLTQKITANKGRASKKKIVEKGLQPITSMFTKL